MPGKLEMVRFNALVLPARQRASLARDLLESLEDSDFTYGNFESAKAVQKYVKKARTALRGLPL